MLASVADWEIIPDSNSATAGGALVSWRTSATELQVAVAPVDPASGDRWSASVADAIRAWMLVNGVQSPSRVLSPNSETTAVEIVLEDVKIGAAIEAEFGARGMKVERDGPLQDSIVFLVRSDHSHKPEWSVWMNGRETEISVRNHIDAFDAAGESAVLRGILERAFGRTVDVIPP